MRRQEVLCPVCGRFVGWDYPDTYDEPGFFEGDDTFRAKDGLVLCCAGCLFEYEFESEEDDNEDVQG